MACVCVACAFEFDQIGRIYRRVRVPLGCVACPARKALARRLRGPYGQIMYGVANARKRERERETERPSETPSTGTLAPCVYGHARRRRRRRRRCRQQPPVEFGCDGHDSDDVGDDENLPTDGPTTTTPGAEPGVKCDVHRQRTRGERSSREPARVSVAAVRCVGGGGGTRRVSCADVTGLPLMYDSSESST